MGSRQIVLVSTAGFSVLNTGIFWREARTKRLFSQFSALVIYQLFCNCPMLSQPKSAVHQKCRQVISITLAAPHREF
jgi:hypothetical protein